MKKVLFGDLLLVAGLGYLFSRYWYFLPRIVSSIAAAGVEVPQDTEIDGEDILTYALQNPQPVLSRPIF